MNWLTISLVLLLLSLNEVIVKSTQYSLSTYSGLLNTNIGDGGAASNAIIRYPGGLWGNSNGDIFVIELNNYRIRKISGVSPGNVTTYIGSGNQVYAATMGSPGTATSVYYPIDLWGDVNGDLYYTDGGSFAGIIKCDGATTVVSTVAGAVGGIANADASVATSSTIGSVYGIFGDTVRNLYFTDYGNHKVRKLDLITGLMVTIAGNTASNGYNGDGIAATAAYLNNPYDVWADTNGATYIADYLNFRIRTIDSPLSPNAGMF